MIYLYMYTYIIKINIINIMENIFGLQNSLSKNGSTPLHIMVTMDKTEWIEEMTRLAAPGKIENIDALNPISGKTALMTAVKYNRIECVRLLILAQADFNIPDRYGDTPLMVACYHGYTEIAGLLIDAICKSNPEDLNLQNLNGITALMKCCDIYNNYDIVQLLVNAGVNVNIQDKYDASALIRASVSGFTQSVKILLTVPDINIELVAKNGKNAKMISEDYDHQDIVKLIDDYIAK